MNTRLRISIDKQTLTLEQSGVESKVYPISSGKAGTGFKEGSGQTPTGAFYIYSKHGQNAPLMSYFTGKIPRGIWGQDQPEGAKEGILTRILTLEGLSEENKNTRARYIYIHGTNDVEKLGQEASMGCIRLAPQHMLELFEHCQIGDPVSIN